MRMLILLGVLFCGSISVDVSANSLISHFSLDYGQNSPLEHLNMKTLAPDKILLYTQTINKLRISAADHLKEANRICVFIEDNNSKHAVSVAIGALVSSLASGNPVRVAFTACLCVVGTYLEGCCERYYDIKEHLETSQKCFEMAESFSGELARKQQDKKWHDH